MAKGRMRAEDPPARRGVLGALRRPPRDRVPPDHRRTSTSSTAPSPRSTEEITERVLPFEAAVTILSSIPGHLEDHGRGHRSPRRASDMTRFPTPGQLCAWAGVRTCEHESAGKRRPAGTRHGSTWLQRALIEAARSRRSHDQGQLLRRAVSSGSRDGAAPTRRSVAVAQLDPLLRPGTCSRNGALYEDPGADSTSSADHDPAVEAKRLQRRIEALGYDAHESLKLAA